MALSKEGLKISWKILNEINPMISNLKISVSVFILLILSINLFAQKDITQFIGIPVDGYKSEMIKKLKDKGYTISPNSNDVLVGEFNGTDVHIMIVTNNNKVWRIAVVDAYPMNEADIRVRYNKLLQQFNHNKKYGSMPDSTILKSTIPENEDISYELSVNKKQYQALFLQNTPAYDSLTLVQDNLLKTKKIKDTDMDQLVMLVTRIKEEFYKCLNKKVWFNISERSGKYCITIFYDNEYNKANGEDL